MIESLILRNFKSHSETRVDLGRLTLLAGPNGSGKTSILQALHLVSQLPREKSIDVFKHQFAPEVCQRAGADGFTIELGATQPVPWRAAFVATPPPAGMDATRWFVAIYSTVEGKDELVTNAFDTHPESGTFGTPHEVTAEISGTALLRFSAARLAEPSFSEREKPRIEHDGYGLATVLATAKLGDDESFDNVVRALRRVVPIVEGVRIARTTVHRDVRVREKHGDEWQVGREREPRIADQVVIDFRGARGVPAHAASNGTMLALGLLSMIHTDSRPNLLLLDDIDQGLHPTAQRELVRVVREVLKTIPELQIVATTHSPYLVDEVDAQDVFVLATRQDGTSACRRLSEHPEYERAKEALTAGEFLSSAGDEWLIGG